MGRSPLYLEGGLKITLFPRASIAHDAGIPAAPSNESGRTEMTIGHNVASEAEVDAPSWPAHWKRAR